jgi:hypothetical protein
MGLTYAVSDPLVGIKHNEPIEDYELHIHSHPVLKSPKNFVKYYSGGPKNEDRDIF